MRKVRHAGMVKKARSDSMRFAEFDKDGNQTLDFDEFFNMQPKAVRDRFSRTDIRTMFDAADTDGDGTLSINEFFCWSLGNASSKFGIDALKQAFSRFDADCSGELDKTEFSCLCHHMGFGAVSDEIFLSLDRDGSGAISYGELVGALTERPPVNRSTKELLTTLTWSIETANADVVKAKLDTSGWVVEGDDAETVSAEVRSILLDTKAPISDIITVFDEDADDECRIDDIEFFKVAELH